jgi:hypothetical protein
MKKLFVTVALLLASFLPGRAEWIQTPFGPAWIGPNRPASVQPPVAAPKPAPLVPTYEKGVVVRGVGTESSVNEWYFATKETAEAVCKRFFCSVIFLQPFGGSGGLFAATQQERWLAWPDGVKFNAGNLASYFTRNPEDQFPGLAAWYINGLLKQARDAEKGQ